MEGSRRPPWLRQVLTGYTLLFGTDATLATNLSLYPNVPYNPVKDFAPIMTLGSYQMMLVVNEDVPAKTFPSSLNTLAAIGRR
jgi:tripartite-type tricarboxylate transporter receptor subunit TctC